MNEKTAAPKAKVRTSMRAKKDFHIFCPPEHDIKIKEGDDLSDIPELFITNLKTEGVL